MNAQGWATIISAFVVGVPAIIVGLTTVRQNRASTVVTSALEERKVNRDDFDSITRELRADLVSLRADLTQERAARMLAEARAVSAENRASVLERRIGQLEDLMLAGGMTLPPPLDDPDQ